MPHNGFIYEAQMDMMENSGHCLKSGRPWRGFDFFLHSFIRQYIHSYLGITKNYLSQLIAVYKRCYTFAMQLEILILLIFIRINRKFLIKFLFRMVWYGFWPSFDHTKNPSNALHMRIVDWLVILYFTGWAVSFLLQPGAQLPPPARAGGRAAEWRLRAGRHHPAQTLPSQIAPQTPLVALALFTHEYWGKADK